MPGAGVEKEGVPGRVACQDPAVWGHKSVLGEQRRLAWGRGEREGSETVMRSLGLTLDDTGRPEKGLRGFGDLAKAAGRG